jgi:hypothetical protein
MRALFALSIGLAMQLAPATQPAQILQIYRDFLKPGSDAAYREIEESAARICARMKCPNPYLAIESLTEPIEVWYLNGYASAAHETTVARGYQENAPLMAALDPIPKRKAGLILAPLNIRTTYRADLTRGRPWRIGEGRFIVITVTKGTRPAESTVFEAEDGTQFIVRPVQTRDDADAIAKDAGADTKVFAVRPLMSMPAQDWIARDPNFWQPKAP